MAAYLYIHYDGLDGATLSYLEKTTVKGIVDMITLPGRRDTWVYTIDAKWLEEWVANHGTSIQILGDEEQSYQLQELMMKELDNLLTTPEKT